VSCLASGLSAQLEFIKTYWESSLKPKGTLCFVKPSPPIPIVPYLRKVFAYMNEPTDLISLLQMLANSSLRQMSLRSGKSTGDLEVVLKKYTKFLNALSY
jgi:hypothetical protein